jgi:hypothetical protein
MELNNIIDEFDKKICEWEFDTNVEVDKSLVNEYFLILFGFIDKIQNTSKRKYYDIIDEFKERLENINKAKLLGKKSITPKKHIKFNFICEEQQKKDLLFNNKKLSFFDKVKKFFT